MDITTRNVLRHVYEALKSRERLATNANLSNLQLFYNRLLSDYSAAEKRSTCLIVPLTGQDVDDFYSGKMTREAFVEIVRSKLVAKVTNFDADLMHKICWECYTNSHDPNQTKFLALISQQSAITLWLIFNKLDTDGTLYLHPEDVSELICHLFVHLRVNYDKQNITQWFLDYVSNPSSWIDFWTFFAVASEKCLGPRGGQATAKAIQQLYDEVVGEVIKCTQMIKKGHRRHTWKMRWFVLTATDLIYYESKEILVKKGSVALNYKSSVEVMQDKNEKDTRYPNRFKVTDGINGQFTEISADSLAQMNEWVEAIRVAIKLNVVEGRNYLHKLIVAQNTVNDPIVDFPPSATLEIRSPLAQSGSCQSLGTIVDGMSSSSSSGNKIDRKISLPVMPSNPPLKATKESLSEQSSLDETYAVVDKAKKKKNSTGAMEEQKTSTRPIRIHDYEDIDDENLPPFVPPYRGEVFTSNSPVKKTMAQHSQSIATTVDSDRGDEVALRGHMKPTGASNGGPRKRHSSIDCQDDFLKANYGSLPNSGNKRAASPVMLASMHSKSFDVADSTDLPPAVPVHQSPMGHRKAAADDNVTPPLLPPKKKQSELYSEVPANRQTTFALNGIAAQLSKSSADGKGSSYADLDFSDFPNLTNSSTEPPVDHTKRDYADIDFSSTQRLEKTILGQDSAGKTTVELPPKTGGKGVLKKSETVEDKSGYVKVDYTPGAPRQMMVVQPQISGRTSPLSKKSMSSDAVLVNRPVPTPRSQTSAPSLPPHANQSSPAVPPPLPPKAH